RDAMLYVGMDVLRTGAVRRQEKTLHTSALQELSEGFEDEVRPLVIDIEGTQHRLVGTAEAQYDEWRDLLRRLFMSETGFVPENVEVYAEPDLPALEPGAPETETDPELFGPPVPPPGSQAAGEMELGAPGGAGGSRA